MQAIFKKVITPAGSSFTVREDEIHPQNCWHYHPEFEILYFPDAKGINFIGDNIEPIHPGEILLVGPNLPHATRRDIAYYEKHPEEDPKVICIQFEKNFLGKEIWQKPEFLPVAEMLAKAGTGIRFNGKTAELAVPLIMRMIAQKGVRKITLLLSVLEVLANNGPFNFISSCGFMKNIDGTDEKINKVYEYTISNFREDIPLDKICSLVYLSQSTFCRYFKSHTGKTYNQFLREMRIGYACKLLLEGRLNISQVCFECGYKNISNFNRHFKEIMHVPPSEYYRTYESASTGLLYENVA
jgi:AraC-like DNA-binding protein